MSPGKISSKRVLDRLGTVDELVSDLRAIPGDSLPDFLSDWRNSAAAESAIRRSLEALFDIGRHILAKGFAVGVVEYKETAEALLSHGVLSADESALLRTLAGYRNRLVHFYHEVSRNELYEIRASGWSEILSIAAAYRRWLAEHPERVDEGL